MSEKVKHSLTFFYNVLSLKALLSDIARGNELSGAFWWRKDGLDMNETRTLMAHLPPKYKNTNFDTVLGLTAAKKFHNGYDDVDYGISALGGACGTGEWYEGV